jgi:hypothetical protein
MQAQKESNGIVLTSALDRGGWLTQQSDNFSPEKEPVQEAGWAPAPIWRSAENLTLPTGIRSPNRPVFRQALYLLSYSGPFRRTVLSQPSMWHP